jgi:hypothetical protein
MRSFVSREVTGFVIGGLLAIVAVVVAMALSVWLSA